MNEDEIIALIESSGNTSAPILITLSDGSWCVIRVVLPGEDQLTEAKLLEIRSKIESI